MPSKQLIYGLLTAAILLAGLYFFDPDLRTIFDIASNKINSSSNYTINQNQDGVEFSKVSRVVDGDTVLLDDGRKVRMLNIDTPETVKENTPVMCYGKEASEYTKKILTGQSVSMISDKEKNDKYGRALRIIFLRGQDTANVEESINATLIKKGMARVGNYKPNITYEKQFKELEKSAKNNKIGVWACSQPFVQ
jgi:micrococcal nuclease